jgi:hypothetical protein
MQQGPNVRHTAAILTSHAIAALKTCHGRAITDDVGKTEDEVWVVGLFWHYQATLTG